MGNCRFCGKTAGLFRSEHAECAKLHEEQERLRERGRQQIADAAVRALKNSEGFEILDQTITEIEKSSFVPSTDRQGLLVAGWENAVNQFLEDGVLDAAEEKRLV